MSSTKKISKAQIMGSIVDNYFDDLEFIEALNNLTYGRKVVLQRKLKNQNL